jgi:class 3 adenylate cyclase
LTGSQHATILMLDEHESQVRYRVALDSANMPPLELVAGPMMSKGLAGWVVRERRAALVRDTEQDARWLPGPGLGDLRSAIVAPLLSGEHTLGILTLGHEAPDHFGEMHLRLVEILSTQAALAVAQASADERAIPTELSAALPDLPIAREVVALSAELRGLTAAGAQIAPDVFFDEILRIYFGTMADVVQHYGGSVDSIAGDTLLAIFGAEDGSALAGRAAIAIQVAAQRLRARWREQLGVEAGSVDIGIARGPAIIGTLGVSGAAGHVVGDVVGQATRLRELARGGETLVAAAVVAALIPDGAFTVEALPPLRLGGSVPQPLFLISASGSVEPAPIAGRRRP